VTISAIRQGKSYENLVYAFQNPFVVIDPVVPHYDIKEIKMYLQKMKRGGFVTSLGS
jgi:hypothetical protein